MIYLTFFLVIFVTPTSLYHN